jgi:histidinol-phosphate/aromatic aminotransferase/cobyric acid decarboxylase-like protein
MRTVSKLGLAGLRLGFIAGQPGIISELNKVRLPYNPDPVQNSRLIKVSSDTLNPDTEQFVCT